MIVSPSHQWRHAFVIKASATPHISKVDAQLPSRGPPSGMYFPLSHLPLELALEIIRLGRAPHYPVPQRVPRRHLRARPRPRPCVAQRAPGRHAAPPPHRCLQHAGRA